jgi:translation initiation factor IF-3
MFRGREVVHPEIGAELLRRVATELQDVGKIERPPKLDGKRMTMVVTPVRR